MKVPVDKLSVYSIQGFYENNNRSEVELMYLVENEIKCSIYIACEIDKDLNIPRKSIKFARAFDNKGQPCDIENFNEIKPKLKSFVKEFSEQSEF